MIVGEQSSETRQAHVDTFELTTRLPYYIQDTHSFSYFHIVEVQSLIPTSVFLAQKLRSSRQPPAPTLIAFIPHLCTVPPPHEIHILDYRPLCEED